MTTTSINNIHNLKHFNQIQTLLQIEDLEVFATEINFLYEKLEQYASEIDAAVKNSELMKAAINDYENERQYLMDKIEEMQGTTNIYIFDKEDKYNDIQIQQEQEQEKEQQEQAEYNTIPEHFININENIIIEEKKELSKEEILKTVIVNYDEEQEQQEETYIFHNNGMYDYDIYSDKEFLKRKDNKSPLSKYNTFEDYINNFSIYDKEDKKSAVELFYKKEVIEHILKTAKNILFKYSILKSYDAYSDYNSTYRTFDFDFIINLKD